MTDSVDFCCIVAPKGVGEARIPGLVTLADERTVLFFDERPAPASGTGSDFNGLTMASDLPNPNRILWMEREGSGWWSESHPLPAGGPPVSSDACVGVDGDGLMHLAFASTDGRVGYMDSRADGERLRAWWAWGSGPEDFAYVDMTDELYELTGADALFATSGGTVALDGAVALPYVVRVGDETHVRVAYARAGRLVANCRIQGFEGRGSGARCLAWGDGRTWEGACLWELEDPGCNARMIGDLFVHPGRRDARAGGEILRLTPPWEGEVRAEVVSSLGDGTFGYSDVTFVGDEAVVVFERDRGLWEAVIRR